MCRFFVQFKDRNHSFTPDPRWASPLLRPGLNFRYTQRTPEPFGRRNLQRVSANRPWPRRFSIQPLMTAKAYLNSCDDASWCDLVYFFAGMVCSEIFRGCRPRFKELAKMAARLVDGAKTDKSPAPVSHFISDGLKVDRVSLLQLSQR